eukprot:TRINITY_DN5722_c0_g1_i2.p1 TRINITY_DN5722_c0_g1~~TRINITY_DN5722_c0_g1_i2.p1  ORF type:complete len:274 (-),score=51.62 TRINITY_DN5722_c0_g1_i2:32-853(-)
MNRKEAFEELQTYEEVKVAVLGENRRPPLGEEIPVRLQQLIIDCWSEDPDERPEFSEILEQLTAIGIDLAVPDHDGSAFWTLYANKEESLAWTQFWGLFEQFCPRLKVEVQTKPELEDCMRALLLGKITSDKAGIVTIHNWGKFLSLFGPLSGKSPSLFEKVVGLCREPYFHGDITSQEAFAKLHDKPSGTFLVRVSQQPGFFTVSCKGKGQKNVIHTRIAVHSDGRVSVDNQFFATIPGLVTGRPDLLMIPCSGSEFQMLFRTPAESENAYV